MNFRSLSLGIALLCGLVRFAALSAAPVTALAFTPDGTQLLAGGSREMVLYQTATAQVVTRLALDFPKITGLAFDTNRGVLAVSGGTPGVRGGVQLINWPEGSWAGSLSNHADQATSVTLNPTGTRLASTGVDGVTCVLKWPEKTLAYQLEGHSGPVLSTVFSPDGTTLITASADRSIKVWESAGGKLQRSFTHHTDIVHHLAIRPSALQAAPFQCASAGQDGTVRIWQPSIGRLVRIIRNHNGPVFAVAYSPDGATLYSAGAEGIVRVMEADSDVILNSWKAHPDWIYTLAVSPDGRRLATGDWAGTIKLWKMSGHAPKLEREMRPS